MVQIVLKSFIKAPIQKNKNLKKVFCIFKKCILNTVFCILGKNLKSILYFGILTKVFSILYFGVYQKYFVFCILYFRKKVFSPTLMIVHCWHRRVCNRLGCHHPVLFWYRDSHIHHRFYAENVMNFLHHKFCTLTINGLNE